MEKNVSRFRGKLKILVVNMMIIQFRLKLDKFYSLSYELTRKENIFLMSCEINI